MTTAVVILNWNGKGFLEKYLPGLIDSAKGLDGISIVVADSGSEDGSMEMMKERFPSVSTLPLGRNYGFAEGYNRALAQIEADCYLLLNSDIEVTPQWLCPLIEWMELHPECGICGPKLHKTTERDCFEYAGAAGGYIDRFGYPFCRGRVTGRTEKDSGQYDIPAEVLWVSGAALMIRSSLYRSLGGLWSPFFAHMEEIDLCWRARLAGWKVNIVPRSMLYHVGGGSLSPDSPFKLYLNYRNNLLMMNRNLPKTLALHRCLTYVAKFTEEGSGPDFFESCFDTFADFENELAQSIVGLSVRLGKHRAAKLIRRRMCLDGLSAAVYLMRGKFSFFKSVVKAHRDFRKMRVEESFISAYRSVRKAVDGSSPEVARTILTCEPGRGNAGKGDFALKGMWRKWIVWQSVFNSKGIFREIKDTIK